MYVSQEDWTDLLVTNVHEKKHPMLQIAQVFYWSLYERVFHLILLYFYIIFNMDFFSHDPES